MTQLIEKFYPTSGTGNRIFDTWQYSQSFITPYDFSLTVIKLLLWRSLGGNGEVFVNIYAADGDGKPTGGSLANDDAIVIAESYDNSTWVSFNLSAIGKLPSGNAYVVVMKNPNGTITIDEVENATSSYAETGPKLNFSTNSGSTWDYMGITEMALEVWGYPSLVDCVISDSISIVDNNSEAEHVIPPDPDPVGSSRRIGCLGDPSSHGGVIISTNADGSCQAGGTDVAVHGANHSCPLREHGVTPVSAIVSKTKHNGKLVITRDAVAGCGAVIIPPNRRVYVE